MFGLIGADFLVSFATAQASHARSVAELASHYPQTTIAAHTTADSYDSVDSANGAALGAVRDGIGGHAQRPPNPPEILWSTDRSST
ncbi:hypothetical protein ACFWAY_42125 [Rhodococcus sp. NPDC059968]|uniref:hypothetical protein n=1 Tax=Rhodococcus sp. NPDC059968 TaxID=3347017 RepID=UPI003671AE8A